MNELIQRIEALSAELKALEDKSAAAWKARRKLESAAEILKAEAPKEEPAKEAEAPKAAKPPKANAS